MSEPLLPGFTRGAKPGVYLGALRRTRKSDPVWTCPHAHAVPAIATRCAVGEEEKRAQGRDQVFFLLHCGACTSWWPDAPGVTRCAGCGVPMERVKLAVLERLPLVPGGNRSR